MLYQSINAKLIDSFENKNNIAVVFGKEGLNKVLSEKKRYDIAIFLKLTKNDYEKLKIDNVGQHAAIFVEPPVASLVYLSKYIFGEKSRVTIPYASWRPDLAKLEDGTIKIRLLEVGDTKRWLRNVKNTDAILAIPDSSIYNSSSLTPITASLFRRSKALIGYSKKMVNYGALASVYVHSEEVAKDLFALFVSIDNGTFRPGGQYVSGLRVEVNTTLGNALGIYDLNSSDLQARVNKHFSRVEKR